MKKIAPLPLLISAALCVSAAIAIVAVPKLGGTYVGSTVKGHRIRIKVASKPTKKGVYKGTFQYCGLKIGIVIVHGHFGARQTAPSIGVPVTLFRAFGSFDNKQSAHGRVDLDFSSNCKGQPGDWTATLK